MTDQLETELRAALRERAAQVPDGEHRPPHSPRLPPAHPAAEAAGGDRGARHRRRHRRRGRGRDLAQRRRVERVRRLDPDANPAGARPARRRQRQLPDAVAGRGPPAEARRHARAVHVRGLRRQPTPARPASRVRRSPRISATRSSAPIDVPAGHILLSSSHATNSGGQAYSFADGRTGAGVNGGDAESSTTARTCRRRLADGWFVAWWPGASQRQVRRPHDADRHDTQTFDLGHASPCEAVPCAGSASWLWRR